MTIGYPAGAGTEMKSRTIYIFAALFSVVFFFVMIKMTPPMGPDEAVVIACLMFIFIHPIGRLLSETAAITIMQRKSSDQSFLAGRP